MPGILEMLVQSVGWPTLEMRGEMQRWAEGDGQHRTGRKTD